MEGIMIEPEVEKRQQVRRAPAALAVAALLLGFGAWACQRETSPPTSERAAEPAIEPYDLEGFGKAKFKMTPDEVRAVLPDLEPLEEDLGAAIVGGPYAKRFVLRDFEVPGFQHKTNVEIRFWNDRLWVVIVYFGENDFGSVVEAMEKLHGTDSRGDDKSRVWVGEKTTAVVTDRERYYSISDNDLSAEARAALFQGIHPKGGSDASSQ
jgi:hypothetical protein